MKDELILISKIDLDNEKMSVIGERISDPIHVGDLGPITVWNTYTNGMYAVFGKNSNELIALLEASGSEQASPGWWIDSKYRSQGYGKLVVDVLAKELIRRGVKSIGKIPITTKSQEFDEQSKRLVIYLRSYFPQK